MIGGAGSARPGDHGWVSRVLVLDGPVGTELARRGVPTPLPLWSAAAIDDAPDALRAIHAEFAAAGATVHVENLYGENNHHIVESCFKGLARSLRAAIALDARATAAVPSTKGTLSGGDADG